MFVEPARTTTWRECIGAVVQAGHGPPPAARPRAARAARSRR